MKENRLKKILFFNASLIILSYLVIREYLSKDVKTAKFLVSIQTVKGLIRRYGIINLLRVANRAPKNLNFSTSGITLFKNAYLPKIQKPALFTAIEVTNRCPYRCKGCYIDIAKRENNYFMPENLLRESIKKLSYGSLILIQGGEPLRKNSAELLYRVIKDFPEQAFVIVTTGVYLSQYGLGDFKELNNIVWSISINGTEEISDKLRFKGSFKHAIQAMRNIKEAQQYFSATVTISKDNAQNATSEEFVMFLENEGVKEIKYLILRDPTSDKQLSLKEVEYYDEYTKRYNKFLFTTFTRYESDGYVIIDPYGNERIDRTGNDKNLS